MKLSRFTSALSVVAALLIPRLMFAGTLDDAPFHVILPDSEWQIEDSTAQPMGNDIFLVASLSNANSQLRSTVIKAVFKKTTDSAFDKFCAGIRESLTNPAVKKISEDDTTFLGYKAKTFIYQVTPEGGQTTYNETMVFVSDGNVWAIASIGRPDQKDEIKKIIGFYQKKAG